VAARLLVTDLLELNLPFVICFSQMDRANVDVFDDLKKHEEDLKGRLIGGGEFDNKIPDAQLEDKVWLAAFSSEPDRKEKVERAGCIKGCGDIRKWVEDVQR